MQATFAEYVSSPYGQKTFNITMVDKIVASKMDQILKEKLAMDEAYFAQGLSAKSHPHLNPAFMWHGQYYIYYYPEFLEGLSDKEYQATFAHIWEAFQKDMKVYLWPTIVKIYNTIVDPLRKLLLHIMFFIILNFTMPENASKEYCVF
ncbi:hypothetical protein FQN50_009736 [Emmonsiellopsis sp. PD_5]|nr:hypothetical protein FQN50_009736 [Emmonsiellopsis sp. PD_5]